MNEDRLSILRIKILECYNDSAIISGKIDHNSTMLVPSMELQRDLIRALGAVEVLLGIYYTLNDEEANHGNDTLPDEH